MANSNFDYQKPRQDNISNRYTKDGVEVFIGRLKPRPNPTGTPNTQIIRPMVTAVTPFAALESSSHTSGYNRLAMMSLDGLLRPVSLAGDGDLPRYFAPDSSSQNIYSPPILKLLGFTSGGGSLISPNSGDPAGGSGVFATISGSLGIKQLDTNPVKNPTGVAGITDFIDTRSIGSKGHDLELLAQRSSMSAGQSLVTCIGSGQGAGHVPTYSNDYRLMALRGPLLIQGWGYDLEGKPVPNSADSFSNASQGIFTTTNLTNKFMPNYLQSSKAWPVAPLDLRLDRKRGVWTVPQFKLLFGRAVTGIVSSGAGLMRLADGMYIDDDGAEITGYVNAIDKIGGGLSGGAAALIYYNPSANEHWLIGGGGGGSSVTIRQHYCSGYGATGTGVGGVTGSGSVFVTTAPVVLSQLIVGNGINLETSGSAHIISAGLRVAQFTGGCFGTGTGQNSFDGSNGTGITGSEGRGNVALWRLGAGLRVGAASRQCESTINIDTNLRASNSGTHVVPASFSLHEPRRWNRLVAGRGLGSTYADDCSLHIGVNLDVGNLANISAFNTGCGLTVKPGAANEAVFHLNIPINGQTGGISSFSFGHGLNRQLSSAGAGGICNTATIAVVGTGISQSPPILTGVFCSGGALMGQYIRLLFSAIGGCTGYIVEA